MTDNRTTELLREFAENAIYCNQFGSLYADEERIAEYTERIEQAIAATLGNGTCRNEWAEFGKFRCSECWLQVDSISTNTTAPIPIKYCPNCGAKVIQGVYNAD